MKKRIGFVSNSSSSSFVIRKGNGFNNTKDIAKYMFEYIEWLNDEGKEKLIKILDSVKDDENLFFHTTNYDTYIRYIKEFYIIDTANNHDWGDDLIDNSMNSIPDKYKNYISLDWGEVEYVNNDDYECDFYSLPHDIKFKRLHWDNKIPYENRICKKDNHYEDKLHINGKLYCPICDLEILKRTEKIKKLLDK